MPVGPPAHTPGASLDGATVARSEAGGNARPRREDDFDRFFAAQYTALVRTLLAMTGRRAVSEEIAQEALLAAHRRWDVVRSLDRPDLWVRRAAINRAISFHRRLLAEAAALARVAATAPDATPAIEPPDDRVWSAVQRLGRRQRVAVVLSLDGYRASDIGAVLGCSAATAQTHLHRGRSHLARELQSEEEE